MYQQAADRLVAASDLDPDRPFVEQVEAGLDAHFDYYEANRNAVLTANRTLAGDRAIQAIIEGELDSLRNSMVSAARVDESRRQTLSTVFMGWLVFVRTVSVEWLVNKTVSRDELRSICVGALLGAVSTVETTPPPSDGPWRYAWRDVDDV